jgi:hypothetical protein
MTTASSGKNISLLYGLLYGGASILFTVILYLGGAARFMSPLSYLGPVITIGFTVLTAYQQKKQQGGYLEFGEALKTTFLMLVTGSLLALVFEYILFNYIDVPFAQALAQATAEKLGEAMEKTKIMSQEKIDEAVEQMLNTNNYTIGKMVLGFAVRCIGLFILALIVSAIMKKKRPVFENTINQ